MKKIKIILMLLSSLVLVSCSNYQPPKEVISVNYSEDNKYKVTTFKDGTTRTEDLELMRLREEVKKEREDRKEMKLREVRDIH